MKKNNLLASMAGKALALAAAMMMSVAFTACSSDDDAPAPSMASIRSGRIRHMCLPGRESMITKMNKPRRSSSTQLIQGDYKPTATKFWFYYCTKFETIEGISNLSTDQVTDMGNMFGGCNALTTIYCNDTWTCDKSENMFSGCENLKGAVAYDAGKTDITMANLTTGYFTKKDPTGISTPTADTAAKRRGIYTLQGVKLNTAFDRLPAGVYIVDGKKVVKK